MFDGFLAGMLGALTSMIRLKSPAPVVYIASFLIGAVAAEPIMYFMVGSSTGYAHALSLMRDKVVSPEGIGPPLLGGIMATSVFWFTPAGPIIVASATSRQWIRLQPG